MTLEMLLMSLGVGLEQQLGTEFGADFDEFDEFGGVLCCVVLCGWDVLYYRKEKGMMCCVV